MCDSEENLTLLRYVEGLQSNEKFIRKSVLEEVRKDVEGGGAERMFEPLHMLILRCFTDKAEGCRELALDVITLFVELLPLNDYYLTYIIPSVTKRIGQPETLEECEEIRLKHVILIRNIIVKYRGNPSLTAFLNDFTSILSKTCLDSFPKIKVESCQTISLLSDAIKNDFHLQADSFVRPVLNNFPHQQSRVRVAAVQAIGAIVLNGTTKCFEESVTLLAEKLFDEIFVVRLAVVNTVGQWMLHYRDRYSFWHRMIPLLLTGLSDVHPVVVDTTNKLWEQIGFQFIEENEQVLKDKLDFEREALTHYPPVDRPNLGCRTLVERNIGKIIPAIINELDGWQTDACLRSAQLLSWLVLYAETSILQHVAVATRCFLLGAKSDNIKVSNEIFRAAELLGYFVSPDTWWELLSPEIDNWPCLGILSSIIKGSEPEKLVNVYLKKILRKLSKPDRCRTLKAKYQTYLLKTCENLMEMCESSCQSVGQEMFNILFSVLSLGANDEIKGKALALLRKLSVTLECGNDVSDICVPYVGQLLSNITTDAFTWTMVTPDRCILETIMVHSGKALGSNLHLLSPLLVEVSAENVEPEVKLRLLTNLSCIVLKTKEYLEETSPDHLAAFMRIILEDVITPNLVWSAGKSAESIRTAAVFCLCTALQGNQEYDEAEQSDVKRVEIFANMENLESHINKIFPLLSGILDDNSSQTRLYTMRAVCCITKIAQKKSCFTSENLHTIYPVVMKRLDDPNDTVRLASVQTLCLLFMSRPDSYDVSTFQSHLDAVYSAMLVHLDDSLEGFVKETLAALKELSEIHPQLLKKKVEAKMSLFRNKMALELLGKHLESLSI